MSDNPTGGGDDNTDIFNVGINFDSADATRNVEQFGAAIDEVAKNTQTAADLMDAAFKQIGDDISVAAYNMAELAKESQSVADSAQAVQNAADAQAVWDKVIVTTTADLNAEKDALDARTQAIVDSIKAEQDATSFRGSANEFDFGAGGYNGPTGDTGGDSGSGGDSGGDSSGGGGGLNPFGPGRALGAAGRLTGAPGLRDVGGSLYIIQAMSQVSGALDNVAKQGGAAGTVIDALGGGIGSLGVIGAGAAVAIGLAMAALQAYNESMKLEAQNMSEDIARLDEYFSLHNQITTAEAQAEVDKLTHLKTDSEAESAILAKRINDRQEESGISIEALAKVNAADKELLDTYTKVNDSSVKYSGKIDALNIMMQVGVTVANDLAAALQKAQDQQIKSIDDQAKWEVERQKLIEQGNAKAVQSLMDNIQTQEDANNEALSKLKAMQSESMSAETRAKLQADIDKYTDSNKQLAQEYADLHDNILPLIDNLNNLKNGISGFGQSLAALGQMVGPDTFDYMAKKDDLENKFNDQQATDKEAFKKAEFAKEQAFQEKTTQEKADFAKSLSRQDADQADKVIDDRNKLYASVNDITAKADAKAVLDRIDLADKEQQITADLADKIREISKKASADELDAAESLDSRKIAQLQRSAAQNIETATDAADKQKAKLDKETEKKINDEVAAAQKERDLKLAQGLQQIQDQEDQYALKRQREIDDNTEKMQREQQAHDDQMQQDETNYLDKRSKADAEYIKEQKTLTQHYIDLVKIHTTGKQSVLDVAQEFWNKMLGMAQNANNSVQSAQPAATFNPNTPGVPQSATYGIGDLSGYASQYLTAGQTQAVWQAQNPTTGMDGQNMPLLSGNSLPSPDTSSIPTSNWYSQQYQHFADGGVPQGFWTGEKGPEFVENVGGIPMVHNNQDSMSMLDKLSDHGSGAGSGQSSTDNSSKQTNIYIDGNKVTGGADRDSVRKILLETIKGL